MRHQSRLHHCHNIDNLREAARKRLPRFVYDYLEGGADDEFTLTPERLGVQNLVTKQAPVIQ